MKNQTPNHNKDNNKAMKIQKENRILIVARLFENKG